MYMYVIGFMITACFDTAILYEDGVELFWAMVFGMFNGLIWPVRWAWDLVAYLLNKKKGV